MAAISEQQLQLLVRELAKSRKMMRQLHKCLVKEQQEYVLVRTRAWLGRLPTCVVKTACKAVKTVVRMTTRAMAALHKAEQPSTAAAAGQPE